jgi:hypothetical protein
MYLSIYSSCFHLERRTSEKRLFHFSFLSLVSTTPWTGDQPIARPLPIQDNTNIDVLIGIQTHDPSVRADEDIHAVDRADTLIGQL